MRTFLLAVAAASALVSSDAVRAADPPERLPTSVRVLLFSGGPSREYQFCRRVFVQETERMKAVLSICLQVTDPLGLRIQDVPAERFHPKFPDSLDNFDVIVAVDPDWNQLSAEQLAKVNEWVTKQGGGLIFIAAPVNTFNLSQAVKAEKLQPIRDLLPVEPDDSRSAKAAERSTRIPWRIQFHKEAEKAAPFLKLDPEAKDPFAGWAEFLLIERHIARERKVDHERIAKLILDLDAKEFEKRDKASKELGEVGWPAIPALEKALKEKPSLEVATRLDLITSSIKWDVDLGRGFHTFYPVKKVKPAATLLASFGDPAAAMPNGELHPYLATMPAGKGKVVWLGSGEMWRLRTHREAFHDRFWVELAQWVRSK